MVHTVFVVDDDPSQLAVIQQVIEQQCGCQVITAQGGKAAMEYFMLRRTPQPDVMLIDLMMQDISGLGVIRAIRRTHRGLPIIALSSQEHGKYVVEALRAGADDVLIRPASIEQLKRSLQNHMTHIDLRAEMERLSRHQRSRVSFSDVMGSSRLYQNMMAQAKRASDTSASVLIEGEEGVGKELLGRAIHGSGARSGEPLIVINAAWLHEQDDMEKRVIQAFTEVKNGTVIIKKIDRLDEHTQKTMLHMVQDRLKRQDRQMRLVATTHSMQHLKQLVRQSKFDEELYFRVTGYPITVLPLSERMEDIPLLAQYFVKRFAAQFNRNVNGISEAAMQLLCQHHWPRNIAELAQLMQWGAMQCEVGHLLKPQHIIGRLIEAGFNVEGLGDQGEKWLRMAERFDGHTGVINLLNNNGSVRSIDELEQAAIRYTIKHCQGKMTEVAKQLGIGRSTLYRKIQDYDLSDVA